MTNPLTIINTKIHHNIFRKNIAEHEKQSKYSKNEDLYQNQYNNLAGCSEMQIKYTIRPQNNWKYVPKMSRNNSQEKNVTVQNSITLHRNQSNEQLNTEPHLITHNNAIQHREQMENQGNPMNNEYNHAENIEIQEDRPQMGQQRRLPNAVQLRNQNQADATNNPRLRNQNIIIQDKTKGKKSYDKL